MKGKDYINDKIQSSDRILLSTHESPDCDGLGSEIAFYYYLRDLGKTCRIINVSPVPYNFKRIDPDNVIEMYDKSCDSWLETVELSIIFDIGDFRRVGKLAKHIYGIKIFLNIGFV